MIQDSSKQSSVIKNIYIKKYLKLLNDDYKENKIGRDDFIKNNQYIYLRVHKYIGYCKVVIKRMIKTNQDNSTLKIHRSGKCTVNHDELNTKKLNISNSSHTRKSQYKCNKCNRNFLLCSTLQYHKHSHSDKKHADTDTFSFLSRLQKCKNSDDSKKKKCYLASDCKIIKLDVCQVKHIKTGQIKKPKKWGCNKCTNTFTGKWNATQHLLKHSEEKKYKCKQCFKRYVYKASLTRHIKTHKGKNVECKVCHVRLGYNTSLNRHMSIHMDKKDWRFECDICSKKFITGYQMKTHRRTHT